MGVLLKMRSIFSPHHFWGTANLNLNLNLNLTLNRNFNFRNFCYDNICLITSILTWKLTKCPHKPTEKLGHWGFKNLVRNRFCSKKLPNSRSIRVRLEPLGECFWDNLYCCLWSRSAGYALESVQDFLIKLDRLSKIMNNLLEHLKIHTSKIIFLC